MNFFACWTYDFCALWMCCWAVLQWVVFRNSDDVASLQDQAIALAFFLVVIAFEVAVLVTLFDQLVDLISQVFG